MTHDIKLKTIKNTSQLIFISEVFAFMDETLSVNERREIMMTYYTTHKLYKEVIDKMILLCYHPKGKISLPDGVPPFTTTVTGYNLGGGESVYTFIKNVSRFNSFINVHDKPFIQNAQKRESVFIQMLEKCYQPEIDVILAIKDQELTKACKSMTDDFVKFCFPEYASIVEAYVNVKKGQESQ